MAASFLSFKCNPSLSSLPKSNLHKTSPSYKPTTIYMATKNSYWASINDEVDARLRRTIPIRPPLAVSEPMHQLVFATPRNMAPALCVAACELVGGHKDQAIVASSAFHLIHAALYTHEGLPYLAKSKPRAHHEYGSNVELLIGDGILPLAFEMLARSSDFSNSDPNRVLKVIIEMTRVVGSQGMIEGQYLETQSSRSMDDVCEKKEGGLYACGAACGAILGGASDVEIEKLRRFGLYVGMIHGMTLYDDGTHKRLLEQIKRLTTLAVKQLEGFKEGNVKTISSILDRTIYGNVADTVSSIADTSYGNRILRK